MAKARRWLVFVILRNEYNQFVVCAVLERASPVSTNEAPVRFHLGSA